MLDKSPCKRNITRLRDILLLKANFNSLHKIIFNQSILPVLEKYNLIQIEIVGGYKGQATIHVAINKNLIEYMHNQVKAPHVVTSADAANFYDRVTHPFTSLKAQCFGTHIDYVLVLLKVIQSMSIFLHTSFGTSCAFYSGAEFLTFQGSYQVNGDSPMLWFIISVVLIKCLCLKVLVSQN